MPVFNNALAGAAGSGGSGYTIERSLRFDSGSSSYLSRTPSSAGNRRTFTWSGWVKRCALPSNHTALFTAGTTVSDSGFFRITMHANGHINVGTGSTNILYSGGKLRDFSAWYHVLVSVDTTASSNQVKCYLNGTLYDQATAISNVDTAVNSTVEHQIGRDTSETTHADIYLAEVNFIDGQALAATDFGEFDDNGVWQPKEFDGSYTTSGVSFDFAEQQLYAGGTREALFDGSTSTSCNFQKTSASSSGTAPSNTKRIKVTFPTAKTGVTKLRIYGGGNTSSTNKVWYNDDVSTMITNNDPVGWKTVYTGSAITINSISFGTSNGGSNLRAIEINDVILTDAVEQGLNSFYLDFSDNSSNAALGNDAAGSNDWTVNNLIGPGGTFATGHTTQSYTGNGTSKSQTGVGFSPDLVWIKSRTMSRSHFWFDTKRGAGNFLQSDGSAYQPSTDSTSLTSFDTDGFSIGSRTGINDNNETFAAWMWDAGSGSYANNTDGTITTSTKSNGKFAVTYWSTGTAQGTFGTGLDRVDFSIVKHKNGNSDWFVWHKGFSSTNNNSTTLRLNSTQTAEQNSDIFSGGGAGQYGKVGVGSVLNSTREIIAYSWKEIDGESKFSNYTGNGTYSGASQTITCGFKPALVMIKCTSSAEPWVMFDSVDTGKYLRPHSSAIRVSTSKLQILDTGFKVTGSEAAWNDPNHKYVYMAWSGAQVKQTDSFLDSPTDYEADSGNNGGNYCTFNPISGDLSGGGVTMSNGNLEISRSGGSNRFYDTTMSFSSGKWYWEMTVGSSISSYPRVGIWNRGGTENRSNYPGQTAAGYNRGWGAVGMAYGASGDISSGLPSFGANDTLMFAMDLDNGKLWFGKNGTWYSTGSTTVTAAAIAANTAAARFDDLLTESTGTSWTPIVHMNSGDKWIFNPGSRPFAYTPPTGFKSLCTQNLPNPTIADGSDYFDTKLYTGNGSTQTVSGLEFSPDLVWLKGRSDADRHGLYDTVRGATKRLQSSETNAEDTQNGVTAFNSDGFDIGNYAETNGTNRTYVGWAWDAGSSTASNTDGSITSSVRANPTAGFSIVSYTGNGSTNQTVGHGLNAKPSLVIYKDRDAATAWRVIPTFINDGHYLELNSTAAIVGSSGSYFGTNTSSVLGITGSNSGIINASGNNIIAYCFAHVEGYSAFGKYTGNGSSDGPFIFTNFRPAFILQKRTDTAGSSWQILDTERDPYNLMNSPLLPEASAAEGTADRFDSLSNGFKVRTSNGGQNASGGSFIYAAFAEHPFKYARAR